MDVKKILTTALGLPESATDVEIGYALAETVAPQAPQVSATAVEDAQGTFHELAERTAKAKGISLGEAYSYVSREAPTLAERARARYDLKLWMGSGDGSAAYLPG